MNLAWKLQRLGSMSAPEILYRVRNAVQAIVEERTGLGLARPPEPGESTSTGAWLASLPGGFDRALYVEAADAITQGRYRIFAMRDAPVGFPPHWNRDPRTGTMAPLKFGKTLDYRNERTVGNIKYLWEPNRHLELVTLAQAWHLGRDARHAEASRRMLDSWFEQCPYPRGPNWSSSLELGIRLVNWAFAWHLLGGDESPLFTGEDGARFKRRWLDSIYRHCHFISGHPSLHSSANNHLLGEDLGLFVAATTWPAWDECAQWQSASQRRFEHEVMLQNGPDGVNREQGIWYHHEVADMMLIAGLVARSNGRDFSKAYWERLESMLEFIASVMDVAGHVPAWGDSDDAVMVRFCPAEGFDVYRSLLATGAVLYGRADFKAKARSFDDKSRWLLGDAAAGDYHALAAQAASPLPRRAFPEGGYYVLGSDFDAPAEVRVVADVGPLGYLSIAAHGHADALSFTLSAAGREFLIDPGTYAYHTDRKWRDYFRGTSAHNTLRVDRMDQSAAGGNFLWTRHAQARQEQFEPLTSPQKLVGSHDGYAHLDRPVTHRRTLQYLPENRELTVHDEITGRGDHDLEMHWHFAETCRVTLLADHASIENDGVTMTSKWPQGASARLANGEESPPLGWISRQFDVKVPCTALVVTDRASGHWTGRTLIRIEHAPTGARQEFVQDNSQGKSCAC